MLAQLETKKNANNFHNMSHRRAWGQFCPGVPEAGGHSGPVVVAHPLLDVVQFGLQIFAPALLHPIVRRLKRG